MTEYVILPLPQAGIARLVSEWRRTALRNGHHLRVCRIAMRKNTFIHPLALFLNVADKTQKTYMAYE